MEDKTEDTQNPPTISEDEKNEIIANERKKWEKEQEEQENAKKAKELEKIEAEKKAEEERLAKEREKEEEKKRWEEEHKAKELEKEKTKAEIEKELHDKQKKEAKVKKPGHLKRNLAILLIIVIGIVAAGALTFHIEPALPPQGNSYPYITTYDVLFPDGQAINFAGTNIIAMTDGNEVFLKVGNDRRKMVIGEKQEIAAKHARVKIFGITLVDTDYRFTAQYRGIVENKLDFFMIVGTSQQVPSFIINMLIPPEVNARPV